MGLFWGLKRRSPDGCMLWHWVSRCLNVWSHHILCQLCGAIVHRVIPQTRSMVSCFPHPSKAYSPTTNYDVSVVRKGWRDKSRTSITVQNWIYSMYDREWVFGVNVSGWRGRNDVWAEIYTYWQLAESTYLRHTRRPKNSTILGHLLGGPKDIMV